jgi:glycosyltransferase involved in cell wall biosynthesis
MVSVIIRTFNRAHSIARALDSAVRQTYGDFELLVVDDGSTDNTADVVRSFADTRIRLLQHDVNRGVGAACNTGIRGAKGSYIAWLDSDDLWRPEKLQQQVAFFEKYPEVDAVFTDVCIHDRDVEVDSLAVHMRAFQRCLADKSPRTEVVLTQREMYLCLLQEVPIKPTALMVRRDVFDKVGLFDETTRSGEDWEFLLRLARVSSFGFINRPLAEMNWTPDSTYHRFWLSDKTFLVGVFKRERERLRQDLEAFNAARRGLVHHFKSLGFYYVEAGKSREAANVYLQGFQATHQPEMIFQAGAAFVPLEFRRSVMRFFKLEADPQP